MIKLNSIYPSLLSGIFQTNNISEESENNFLQSLQPYVSDLRNSYRNNNVKIDYSDRQIQAAYLLAYYPGYIYQSRDTLNYHNVQDCLDIDSESITISMFGCGPCPELVAIASLVSEYFPRIKEINANVFDIAVDTWKYSIDLTVNYVIPQIWDGKVVINLHPSTNLREQNQMGELQCLSDSKIITFQNCINEIATEDTQTQDIFAENIEAIVSNIKTRSVVILSDLYGYRSVRETFSKIATNVNKLNQQIITQQSEEIDLAIAKIIIPGVVKKYLLIGDKKGSTEADKNLTPRSKIKYTSLALTTSIKNRILVNPNNLVKTAEKLQVLSLR